MKFVIVFVALFALAYAAPAASDADAEVVRQNSDVGPEGYKFDLETTNGIRHEEQGALTNPGAENEAIAVRGSYSYVADDGQTYTVTYVADENGFQPQGAHLPVAPVA